MQPLLETFWPYVLAGLSAVLIVAGTCHALMWKRDSRAAIAVMPAPWKSKSQQFKDAFGRTSDHATAAGIGDRTLENRRVFGE